MCVAGVALLTACQARAANVTKTVATGSTLKMGGYLAINENCTSMGETVVRMTSEPTLGTVKVFNGVSYPNFPYTNPRSACNVRRVPSTNLEYVPERGFVGTDYFTVEVIYPTGGDRTDSFTINVK